MIQAELTHFHDVWGNAEDGWEVNDQRIVGTIELESWEDDHVLKALKSCGFLKKDVKLEDLTFDDYFAGGVEISDAKNGMPICVLHEVE